MMSTVVLWIKAVCLNLSDNRPNRIDWCVYYFFRWWWNPILVRLPDSPTSRRE